MKITNLISLIGLKSTDSKITEWFETHNLGKPPKTVNANQRNKGATDKINLVSYTFKFDIINDAFYPPVSLKKGNYNFDCYLTQTTVFSKTKKKDFKDPKPLSFWEGFINPESTFEECCTFFDNNYHESNFDGHLLNTTFEKKLTDVATIIVFFNSDKSHITDIELRIDEKSEIFSQYDFIISNEHNTVKQAYTLLVKWLFDNKYLKLSNDIYNQSLSLDHETILEFVTKNLLNHIWDNQITETAHLRSFLYKISSNSDIKISDNEEVNVYIKYLYIKASGIWAKHQEIYNNYDADDWTNKVNIFENSIFLDNEQAEAFSKKLTELFALFCKTKETD
jgi:hypothetical protein